jgi:hypothetical protein
MEQTMVDVHQYATDQGIPYKYALLDSWWYTEGKGGGVKNWTAKAKVFPDGISGLRDKTGWEFQLHNRYWASDNVYAKQNNGSYDFIMDPKGSLALPTSQIFWDDLLQNASEWGMSVYEQDWLHNEFDGMEVLTQDARMGETWLSQMNEGARKAGATIQYCMAYPRHVLSSVQLDTVTQVRASCDYHPGTALTCSYPYCQYNVATSSLLAWAVGLAPSKDNFWSTENQTGRYHWRTTCDMYSLLCPPLLNVLSHMPSR